MNYQTILRPGILPKRPRLSVCMIVGNEEDALPGCLRSVHGIADELIVVDTGSKDDTISIAKDFGAKVYHFKWCDDFAAARNESLKHATGDWILQMDADEELLLSSIPHVRDCMSRPTVLYYLIRCDNGLRCLPRFHWFSRLFRRHPKVRYHRPYHEGIECSIENVIATEPRWQVQYEPNIIVRHYGYEGSTMSKKFERGLPIMKSYLRENPNDDYILSKLGRAYIGLGRYDEAETYLNKALEINPNSSETNYCLGLVLQERGKLDAAMKCYKRAIANDPGLAEAHAHLGAIYIQKGMLDNAILETKLALAINPDLAWAHSNLGLAYTNKGMLDEAIRELKKALAIDPDLPSAHMHLGMVYTKKGMLNEAIGEYKNALIIDPDYAKAYYNLSITYYKKGNYREAIKHCDRAMELEEKIHPQLLELLKPYR